MAEHQLEFTETRPQSVAQVEVAVDAGRELKDYRHRGWDRLLDAHRELPHSIPHGAEAHDPDTVRPGVDPSHAPGRVSPE
jgi:hypothetical protein